MTPMIAFDVTQVWSGSMEQWIVFVGTFCWCFDSFGCYAFEKVVGCRGGSRNVEGCREFSNFQFLDFKFSNCQFPTWQLLSSHFQIAECQIFKFQNVNFPVFQFPKFQVSKLPICKFPNLIFRNHTSKFKNFKVSKTSNIKEETNWNFEKLNTQTFHNFQNFRFPDMKIISLRSFP